MKNIFSLIIGCLFMLSLTGCVSPELKRHNIIVLVDYSSSLDETTFQGYKNLIGECWLNLKPQDRLAILPIDFGSKTQSRRLVFEDLAQQTFSKKHDGITHAADSLQKRFKAYLKTKAPELKNKLEHYKSDRRNLSNSTDIFSALEEASKLLEPKAAQEDLMGQIMRTLTGEDRMVSENTIVLLSDMIHQTREVNFGYGNETNTEKVMGWLKQQHKLPVFENTHVFVYGANGGNNPRRFESIQGFWENYFTKTSAQLVAYGFDTRHELLTHLSGNH